MSEKTKVKTKVKTEPQTGQATLPVGAPPARGYVPQSAPESRLTTRQGLALKALLSSCVKAQAKCEMERYFELGGKQVTNYGHAIRFALDSYADCWEASHDVKLLDLADMSFDGVID